MAKDDMILYLALAGGTAVIMLTDNPIKTAIMGLIPKAGGTDGSGDTTTTDTTSTNSKSKHKRSHKRKHSHFAYAYPAYEDCGY